MLNQIAVWVMDIALVLFAVFKVKRGVNQRAGRLEEQLLFNHYQFSLYHSKASLVGQVCFWLVFIALFVGLNLVAVNAFLLLSLPLILWHFFLTVRRFLWRFGVDGHSAYIRTGLNKRHFLLTDVTNVTFLNARFLGFNSGFVSHIILRDKNHRLARIPVHVVNYQMLLHALQRINAMGIDDLIDEFGQPVVRSVVKHPSWFEGSPYLGGADTTKFSIVYLIVFFGSAFLLLAPVFLDSLILRDAYTAHEVLVGFIMWLSIWTIGIYASRMLFVEGVLFITQVRKQKGKNIFFHMIFLLSVVLGTRLGMDVILFHMENAHFHDIGAAVADLRAIEVEDFGERILNISLDTSNERLRPLSIDAEFGVVYRMWFSSDHQLYFNFPREFRPADLREEMLIIEDENGFRGVNRGQIRVSYTPNMHLITAVEFVDQIPIPEVPTFTPTVIPEEKYFNLFLRRTIHEPRIAREEFLRRSPHLDEQMVNHYLGIITNSVADYVGYEVFTEDRFSFKALEGNQVYLIFHAVSDEQETYHQRIRLRVTFEWEEPVYFLAADETENQARILEHLAHARPGYGFRSVGPLYETDTSTPFPFYVVGDEERILWLWLHVDTFGELRVWGSSWNSE